MNRKVKILTLVLAIAMMVTAFAACGSGKEPTGSTTSGDTQTTTQKPAESKEPVHLLWWQIGGTPTDAEAVMKEANKYSGEKIGVTADIKYIGWGDWGSKVPAIISSGEYYDIMFTNGNYYVQHSAMGAFADITDLVQKEVPELYSFIPELVWSGIKVNDRYFSVPTYKDSSQTQYWVWDKELVDQLGIDYKSIDTYEELDGALKKLKEARPNEYPLFCDSTGLNTFLYKYDQIAGLPCLAVSFEDPSAKVVNPFAQTDVMESLEYMHKWYKAGIINPDAATTKEVPKWRMMYSAQGFDGADAIWSANAGKAMVSSISYNAVYSTSSIQGSVNAISAGSKYVKEALKYLELCNLDPKMRNMLSYGLEGVHYKKTAEGTVEYINDAFRPATYSQATFFTMMPVAPNAPDQWERVKKQNETAKASPILGFSFDPTNVETEIANLKAEYDKYSAEILTGTRNPKEAVPQLNKALEAAGLQKVIDEAQKQVNDFLKK